MSYYSSIIVYSKCNIAFFYQVQFTPEVKVYKIDLEICRLMEQPWCYELKPLESDNRTTLVLSNTKELNRNPFTK